MWSLGDLFPRDNFGDFFPTHSSLNSMSLESEQLQLSLYEIMGFTHTSSGKKKQKRWVLRRSTTPVKRIIIIKTKYMFGGTTGYMHASLVQPGHGTDYSCIKPQTMLHHKSAVITRVFVLAQGEWWAHGINMCSYFKMEHKFKEMNQAQISFQGQGTRSLSFGQLCYH